MAGAERAPADVEGGNDEGDRDSGGGRNTRRAPVLRPKEKDCRGLRLLFFPGARVFMRA